MRDAACAKVDPIVMHPEFGQGRAIARTRAAREVCARCSVTEPCLSYAISQDIDTGIYGGLTYDERLEVEVLGWMD
jgi:WhiB family redox-sensing transcriptional regulator